MAEDLNSLKLVEICRVAPQPPPLPLSPSPPQSASSDIQLSLPLTFFDLLWLRFPHFHRLFFYEIPSHASSDTKRSFFHSTIIPNLKSSLSTALQHFLPLAGNITWPHHSPTPILTYAKGDAVSFTVAESDADFYRLISTNTFDIEAKEFHPLVPRLALSHEKAAVMSFQITLFLSSGGFSVGTAMHHAALDGKILFLFLKSWAHICKHYESDVQLPDHLKPVFDRTVIQDPTGLGLESIYLNQLLNADRQPSNNRSLMVHPLYKSKVLPNSARGSFEFTSTKIEALRQSVIQKQQSIQNLSTFCVTCAYTWVCLVKAEQEDDHEKIKCDKILMVLSVDCRSRLEPAVPENYFGNCVTGHLAFAERKRLLGEDGLVVAVNSVREAVKGMEDNGVLYGAEYLVSSLYPEGRENRSDDVRVFSTAGSHRFKMYETDFGWGRPKSTEVVPVDRGGAITFSDGKNGGRAVDIGLVLEKQHMQAFASLFAQGLENL